MKKKLYYGRDETATYIGSPKSKSALIRYWSRTGYLKEVHTDYADMMVQYDIDRTEQGFRDEPYDIPKKKKPLRKGQQLELFD